MANVSCITGTIPLSEPVEWRPYTLHITYFSMSPAHPPHPPRHPPVSQSSYPHTQAPSYPSPTFQQQDPNVYGLRTSLFSLLLHLLLRCLLSFHAQAVLGLRFVFLPFAFASLFVIFCVRVIVHSRRSRRRGGASPNG